MDGMCNLKDREVPFSFSLSPGCNADGTAEAEAKSASWGGSHTLTMAQAQDRKIVGSWWWHSYLYELLECGVFCALHLKLIRPFHYPKDIFFVVQFYLLTVSFVYSKSFLSHEKL